MGSLRRLIPSRHCNDAGAGHLFNAVAEEQAVYLVDLVNASRDLDDKRLLAHIYDSSTEDLHDLHDLAAVLRVGIHLDERQLSFYRSRLRIVDDTKHLDQLVELLG